MLKIDGDDRYVAAIEHALASAELYDNTFEIAHWVVDISGKPPAINFGNTWSDSRSYSEKRRCAYEMELDKLTNSWKGQSDYDGDAEETALTGTLTFTNGNVSVTGSGTAFTTELSAGDYIILNTDEYPHEIDSVTDNTNLVLKSNYSSTGGSGAGKKIMYAKALAILKRIEIKAKYPKT